jgi:hypothetical protein
MFANEAHDGVRTQVSKANAAWLWTVHLHLWWEEAVALQALPHQKGSLNGFGGRAQRKL